MTAISKLEEVKLPTKYGIFTVIPFTDSQNECHLALVYGDVKEKEDILVRLHSECLTGDTFSSERCDCGQQLDTAMKKIVNEKNGVVLYLRQEGRGIGLLSKLKAYALQDKGLDTVEANHKLGFKDDERNYDSAAEILKQLGILSIKLLTNNPKKIEEMNKSIPVKERVPLVVEPTEHNESYLKTKKEKMSHLL